MRTESLRRLLETLRTAPLIASVQASDGAAVDSPATLLALAQCSLAEGVKVLRLQGIENIRTIKAATGVPVIGLLKVAYSDSEVYITPTATEVEALLDLGCEVIALDATRRSRPNDESLVHLVSMIHAGGALAMGDCDSTASMLYAAECGCDLLGTTLAGYTRESEPTDGPAFDLVRAGTLMDRPIIAEGRYAQRWQVESALRAGATAVVVGGAINDPIKQTRALTPRLWSEEPIGAVDIGGTWLRFGIFKQAELQHIERIPLPHDPSDRQKWIREQIQTHGVSRVGVGTGGTVNPKTGVVWEAKPIIPGHEGSEFSLATLGVPTKALNDGLATAWGHASHPDFAGKAVATLALGTGVGAGFVGNGEIMMGPRGEYPRLNDFTTPSGRIIEALLGGAALTPNPTKEQQDDAIEAFETAVTLTREMIYPDRIVVCGAVGLSEWLAPHIERLNCTTSPYGKEAGLFGSAWLALY